MKNKPLILVIIGNLDVGGAERHLLRVMPELNKKDFQVAIYTTNHRGVLAKEMSQAGVEVVAPPGAERLMRLGSFAKPVVYLISMLYLIKTVRKIKPVVLHYYLPGAYILGSTALLLKRKVHKVMSRRIIYNDDYRKTFLFKLEKWFHRTLNFTLACSKDIALELEKEGVNKAKIDIIYNGVDTQFYKKSYDKYQVLQSLKIEDSPLVMVIVANLYKRKGHVDLLQALKKIKHKLPENWKLIAIGRDGGERKFLEELTKKYGLSQNVVWLGMRLDHAKILSIADFGILCSHEEGFSNALLECMASKLPMVVTNVSGSNEAIIDGVNGLIVPVAAPEKLSEAIFTLASDSDLRKLMAKNTEKLVETKFSLEKVIADYHDFYLRLLSCCDKSKNFMVE